MEAGAAGSDGDDRAHGLTATDDGTLVAAGWLDGAAGHGHDGALVAFDVTGAEQWRTSLDSAAAGPVADATDRWYAVAAIPGTDQLAVCGRIGMAERNSGYHVEVVAGAVAPTTVWANTFDDGLASPDQSCHAVAVDPARGVVTAGWSWANDAVAGQWRVFRHTFLLGAFDLLVSFDQRDFGAVPDQAWGVAVDVGGNIVAVGDVGVAGADGSPLNDTDGRVVKLDRTGRELWEDAVVGLPTPGLLDRLRGVAISPVTNDVAVVGAVNVGTDNAGGADLDGVARMYAANGYLGDGVLRWPSDLRLDGVGSDSLTAAAFDAAGQLFVAGQIHDGAQRRWVVLQVDPTSGAELARATGPAHADGEPTALVLTDDLVALAGWVDDGAGPDFAVLAWGDDADGDGIADVVDGCPLDDDKDDPGVCGCDQPDVDSDGDGLLNCEDACAADADKTDPGVCGCGIADTDSDADGAADCDDSCDADPNKQAPGVCGCGTSDDDLDRDGLLTCQDQCPDSAPGAVVDAIGCEAPAATGDTGSDDAPLATQGCGCAQPTPPTGALPLVVGALLLRLRRRS